MINLEINCISTETIDQSIDNIAEKLFQDFKLQVNESLLRLIDIEFYYYAEGVHEDIYAHQHQAQLESGKWYFHGSGIDITFGNGKHFGGFLVEQSPRFLPKEKKASFLSKRKFMVP